MNELNLNDIDIKSLSEEERSALVCQLAKAPEQKEREIEELDNEIKRKKAMIFAWKNPPKYLREMTLGHSKF